MLKLMINTDNNYANCVEYKYNAYCQWSESRILSNRQ